MPALIGVGAALYGGTALTAIAPSLLAAAAIEVYSIYATVEAARQARAQARSAKDANAQDRLLTIRASAAPKQLIVGKTRTGGVLTYATTHGDRKQYLTMCIALAGHECESIEDIWFDNESIGALDGTATTSGGGGYVTNTSKYWKSDIQLTTVSSLSGYTAGQTVSPTGALSIDSIAETVNGGNIDQGQRRMTEGVDYSLSGTTVTFLVTTTNPVVITYRRDYGRALVRVKKFLGTAAGERDTDLESDSPIVTGSTHEFTSTMVGKNICRIHVTIEFDQDKFGSTGMPNITAVVKGAKFRNWSSGVTEWTENVAQIAAGYLMHPLGRGLAYTRFNVAAMQAAEAACAEDVPTSGSDVQARYVCGGVLRCDSSWTENLRQILAAMAGSATVSGGVWTIRAGVYEAPDYTLDDDDLADGDFTVQPAPGRRDIYNSIRGTYTAAPTPRDSARLYATTDFAPYKSATYISEDSDRVNYIDVSLPLVQDDLQAERIARLLLHRHRSGLTLSATWKLRAWPLQPGDRVYIKSDLMGWSSLNSGSGKVFVVLTRKFSPQGTVEMTLQEDSSAVYAWDYVEQIGVDPAPNTDLPDPSYVARLAGVVITSNATTYTRLSDGTIIPRVEITWDQVVDQGVINGGRIFYVWKRANESVFKSGTTSPGSSDATTRKLYLEPVSANEVLNIGLYCENGAGVRSAPVFATHTVNSDVASGALTSAQSANLWFNASFSGGYNGYTIASDGGLSDTVGVEQPNPTAYVSGHPRNAFLYQLGVQQIRSYAEARDIAVVGGKRYVAYAGIVGHRCGGFLQLRWLDANGAVLRVDDTTTIAASNRNASHPGEYEITSVFVDAPSAAVRCRPRIGKTPTSSQSGSGIYCYKPYFGEAEVGQTDLPMWSDGPQSVGTSQIESGAVSGPSGIVHIDGSPNLYGAGWQRVQDLAVTCETAASLYVEGRTESFASQLTGSYPNYTLTCDLAIKVEIMDTGGTVLRTFSGGSRMAYNDAVTGSMLSVPPAVAGGLYGVAAGTYTIRQSLNLVNAAITAGSGGTPTINAISGWQNDLTCLALQR